MLMLDVCWTFARSREHSKTKMFHAGAGIPILRLRKPHKLRSRRYLHFAWDQRLAMIADCSSVTSYLLPYLLTYWLCNENVVDARW